MLVSESQDKSKDLIKFFKEESIHMVHYHSPMKALDNLQEIMPDVLVMDAIDFPRHWKIMTQYLRYDKSKNDVVILLIVNEFFSAIEVDKAVKVGVQGVLNVDDSYDVVIKKASDILSKYKCLTFRKGRVDMEDIPSNECSFLFIEPNTGSIITGKVKDIKNESILFIPDTNIGDLEKGELLVTCSLKIRDKILTPHCRIVEAESYLSLQFETLSKEDEDVIASFLADIQEERRAI